MSYKSNACPTEPRTKRRGHIGTQFGSGKEFHDASLRLVALVPAMVRCGHLRFGHLHPLHVHSGHSALRCGTLILLKPRARFCGAQAGIGRDDRPVAGGWRRGIWIRRIRPYERDWR